MTSRTRRGLRNHLTGDAAEARIALEYERRGCRVDHRRWRGQGGEIDLIIRADHELIFVEVKQSRNFESAAASLGSRQMIRLQEAAAEFLAAEPLGQLTPVRFDVALVDSMGRFQILENAFGHDG
ncbi:YraN family protein [Ruegeria sp. PrR005]|uniref:UPF0102 protein G0P99_09280 n=1 Tax=Ruegeria sp. PrR005 TaxID=2706882 RepID=A0A6B2NPB7_9RHOB|nr:YraN family protein [Ruegeria sp. PrR005]NDW45150.1 hypothetical protein [Ruegeria sp. PrR005]